jgi:1,4-dihydroxy-2-naphthoate octaprenyltransferase
VTNAARDSSTAATPRTPPFRKLGAYLRELRAPFLPSSALAVFVGTALACHRTGRWDWTTFLACVFGVCAIHAGANVLNDYCDHLSGNDALNNDFVRPFTGGSRLIQQGELRPGEVLGLGAVLLVTGAAAGAWLALRLGPGLLVFLALGLLAGIGYSIPRRGWAACGAGEATVAVAFGVLPVTGAFYAQTGFVTAQALFLALPVAVLIAAVLFINQFQDCRADAAVGKRHWVVRLGRRRASRVYVVLMALWAGLLLLGAATRILPPFLGWAALPGLLAIPASRRVLQHYDHPVALAPANAWTIAMHLLVCAALGVLLILTHRSTN